MCLPKILIPVESGMIKNGLSTTFLHLLFTRFIQKKLPITYGNREDIKIQKLNGTCAECNNDYFPFSSSKVRVG